MELGLTGDSGQEELLCLLVVQGFGSDEEFVRLLDYDFLVGVWVR